MFVLFVCVFGFVLYLISFAIILVIFLKSFENWLPKPLDGWWSLCRSVILNKWHKQISKLAASQFHCRRKLFFFIIVTESKKIDTKQKKNPSKLADFVIAIISREYAFAKALISMTSSGYGSISKPLLCMRINEKWKFAVSY